MHFFFFHSNYMADAEMLYLPSAQPSNILTVMAINNIKAIQVYKIAKNVFPNS
jgi:hypothetical protein